MEGARNVVGTATQTDAALIEIGDPVHRRPDVEQGNLGRRTIIRGEDADALAQLRHAFADDLCPFGATEWEAVEDAADAAWRKRRYRRIEAEIFERAFAEADGYAAVGAADNHGGSDSDRFAGGSPAPEVDCGLGSTNPSPQPFPLSVGGGIARAGEHGRQIVQCMRAGARAAREYRNAIRDLQILRRSRDKGGQSWYESQQARWSYEMDKNTAPSSWVHPDAYFVGAEENARRHPPDVGLAADPAMSARNLPTPPSDTPPMPFAVPYMWLMPPPEGAPPLDGGALQASRESLDNANPSLQPSPGRSAAAATPPAIGLFEGGNSGASVCETKPTPPTAMRAPGKRNPRQGR
jgi:hypothetical protein